MERVLLIDDSFLSLRSFKLPLDLELPEGMKLDLVKPNNSYEVFKNGEASPDEVVGCVKIKSSRATGRYREAYLDVYFNDREMGMEFAGLLEEECRTNYFTDHFSICSMGKENLLTLLQ